MQDLRWRSHCASPRHTFCLTTFLHIQYHHGFMFVICRIAFDLIENIAAYKAAGVKLNDISDILTLMFCNGKSIEGVI